jgi:hypothetical protein
VIFPAATMRKMASRSSFAIVTITNPENRHCQWQISITALEVRDIGRTKGEVGQRLPKQTYDLPTGAGEAACAPANATAGV